MRRSAAPSQNGCAKRPKFVSPACMVSTHQAGISDTKYSSLPFKSQTGVTDKSTKCIPVNLSDVEGSTLSVGETPAPVRKKSDMIALLSKQTWKLPQPGATPDHKCAQQTKAPLSPSKSVISSENNNIGCDTTVDPESKHGSSQIGLGSPQYGSQVEPSPSNCHYYSVMWCKASKKKHKKWEGDAVMSTSGRSVTLYDTEGKIIGRGSGYKVAELETLAEDNTLFVGGKEIQVMSVLTEEQFKSGKCFLANGSSNTSTEATTSSATSKSSFKPFTNPLLKGSAHLRQNLVQEKVPAQPKYDPTVENALVMPRPSTELQWKNTSGGGLPLVDVVVDPYLSSYLRRHQREGVVFLYMCVMGFRDYGGCGAILADEMGLGKTLQCITLIWTLLKQGPYGGKPAVKKILVITPGSLVKNWYAEFKKWLGSERLNVFAVSADNRVQDFVKCNMYPVMVISYEMFVRCHDVLQNLLFDLIICDEGHRLKNTSIKTTGLIMSHPCRRRVVLTGTPVQNDLQEFFSIVEFCNPGILGSSSAFRRLYEEPIVSSRQPRASPEEKELGAERAAELTRLTQMFVLRRTQEVNNDYLPPKVELVLFCRPSPLQIALYKQLLLSKAVRMCLQGGSYQQQHLSGSAHLTIIGALKQLCNHPGLIHTKSAETAAQVEARASYRSMHSSDEDQEEDSIYNGLLNLFPHNYNPIAANLEDSGKLFVLSGILSSLWKYSATEKIVLVSNHTKTLDMLQHFCKGCGYSFLRLDGQTPVGQRQDLVNRFNKLKSHRIFLLSSKAGGVGLNLVGASRLVLYDIDWNPANDLQAMARVWRDGQHGTVYIYRLLTTGSIEEKVYQRQISKQGLSGAVMDVSANTSVKFSMEDLKDLFTLNELTDCETHAMLACPCDGNPNYVFNPTEQTSEGEDDKIRPCQLGSVRNSLVGSKQIQASNVTMAQLLSWKHWRGDYVNQEKRWYLEDTADALSYVFWNETNPS